MGNPSERRSTLAQPSDWFIEALAGGHRTDSGEIVTPNTAMNFAAVQGAIRLLSEVEASLPCHLYRRHADGRGKDRATDSYLYTLLHDSPNPEMTAFQYRQYMRQNRAAWGNAYALPVWSGTGRLKALYPLRPDWMRVYRNVNGTKVYDYQPACGPFAGRYLPQDIIHIRGMGDDLVGWSPLKLLRQGIGLGLAAERFGASFFRNGARHSGILELAGKVKNLEETTERFNEKYAGAINAGKTLVIDQGSKFVATTIPPEDAQYLQTRSFQRSEIYLIYGIPPHMMGDTEKSTSWGTGIEQQTIGFLMFTLGPSLEMTEQEMERVLLPGGTDLFIEHAIDGLLRSDAKTRAEVLQIKRQNGVINADEWRAYDNENPIGGEVGQAYLVNGAMVPVAAALQKQGQRLTEGKP